MSEEEKPQFCKGCPLVPEGVTAVLDYADVVRAGEIRRFRFAHDVPELAAHFIGKTRIHATVVETTNPEVEVDAKAQMMLSTDIDPDEVGKRIRECHQPARRFFGLSRSCGALGPQPRRGV